MKTQGSGMQAHYALDKTTIATCWLLVRVDGTTFAFTDHVEDLTVNGQLFLASTGYTASAMESSDTMSVDNLEIDGYLDASSITKEDLLAGKWDKAAIWIFEVNYTDTTQGILRKRRGWLGEVTVVEGQFTAELRGLTQSVQQVIGRTVGTLCDADLGDARCKIDLDVFPDGKVNGTVTSVSSNITFVDSSLTPTTNWFFGGKVTWVTGYNAGLEMEVGAYTTGGITVLKQAMPFQIQIGDTFVIQVGCVKNITTCRDKFNNVINFRGFPHLPGVNRILSGE